MLVKVDDKLNISLPNLPSSIIPITPFRFTYKPG